MEKLVINSHEEFEKHLGQVLGVSEYLKITQEQINKFAEATLDFQWIHTDVERAKNESPFKTTIAHGYLLMSLLAYFWDNIVEVRNFKMLVNYGIEKLKYNQPVTVDSEVRVVVKLKSIINLRGISKVELNVVMEIKDNPKPALEVDAIFLYHFNK